MRTDTPPPATTANRSDTLVARFVSQASGDPERIAFVMYPMGALHALGTLKWGDWISTARAASGAFLAQHALPGDRVAIFADNRELWPVAAMGISMTGMTVVAIPPDGSAEAVLSQLADGDVSFVVVDTVVRFKMLRALQHQLARPITIICDDIEPLRSSVAEGVYEWGTWCRYGAQALRDYPVLRERLAERVAAIEPNQAASITYAPGSNVGVVRNFATRLADAEAMVSALGLSHDDRLTCARSLSDPFHALLGLDVVIVTGATAALIEHEGDAFRAARHFDATVIETSAAEIASLSDALASARDTGDYLRDVACSFVGRHCRHVITNHSVCDAAFQANLQRAGVAIVTVYGTSWQTAICINGPTLFSGDAIGIPVADTNVRIGEHSELQVERGVHMASGSFTRSDVADTAISSDGGWHCTGMRVERAKSGSFRVVGQMSEMLQFESGRLVAAHPIEGALNTLPLVANAVCDAAGSNSLVAVLSLDRRRVEEWALVRGLVAPWEALVEHPMVYEELARGVALVNSRQDHGERITAFAPTDLEFSVHTGELDASGAIVRSVIASRFRHVFAELHQPGSR